MNHPALRAISVFILLLVSSITQADHLTIRNAWIPEAPPVTSVMAGFMEIENISTTAAEITAISSKDFGRIEMHLSREENGIARMLPQKKLVIPARGTLKLEHGSYHLMLFKPLRRLKDGDS
ncbi:MAG: copper chaperone PCu(A)C, partial [Gammaproteobacteria bacterium]|nr:copper chaperone PCu(A)C [Gammaproteobacteria bacterium]